MTTAKNKLVIIPTGISGHGFVTGYEVLNEAEHRLAWFGVDEVHSPEREANTALALRQAEQFVGTYLDPTKMNYVLEDESLSFHKKLAPLVNAEIERIANRTSAPSHKITQSRSDLTA
jgi:hypothetical protein